MIIRLHRNPPRQGQYETWTASLEGFCGSGIDPDAAVEDLSMELEAEGETELADAVWGMERREEIW